MSMIKAENLTFCYPSGFENIFEDVNFQIDTDWRLGFVGRNGRGKTTFLKLLMGEYEYRGKIISSVQFDYFPYPVEDESRLTEEVLTNICPAAEEWELIRELSYLDVQVDALYRPFSTLSNGERTKVLLAALFLNEGHFLLIDEPTNHLDTAARERVSAYLKRKKGFILVSHDRRFLDGCVDHILSINRANIEVQSGDFSSWSENFERREQFEQTQNDRLKKQIKQLEQSAKQAAAHSEKIAATKIGFDPSKTEKSLTRRPSVAKKAGKLMNRAKSMESRIEKNIEEKSRLLQNVEETPSLKISPLVYHSDTLVYFSEVSPCYGGKPVCTPVSFAVRQGERVVLDGKNGSGKSSLLKLITGEPINHTGTVSTGSGLIISYVPQDTSFLCGSLSDFARESGIDENLFRAILHKMGFVKVQLDNDMRDFSGGQKKKVLIAKSLCEKAHLYIWDEPLNFIDIYSRMQIEELIMQYQPTMVLVEHDGAFREAVGTKFVALN